MALRHLLLPIALLLAVPLVHAQDNPAARAAREWRQQHERAIVDEFIDLLRVPNIASDRDNIRRNAELIAQMMQKRGIESRLLTVEGANPVVFGRIDTPGATRTLVFYAHYDGQPLDPADWLTPPFTPTLRSKPAEDGGQVVALPAAGQHFDPESRLYARSSGDDILP